VIGASVGEELASRIRAGASPATATPSTLERSIDQAVAEGKLRRMPGWTKEQGPFSQSQPPKPPLGQRQAPAPAETPVPPAKAVSDVLTKASTEKIKLNAAEVKAAGDLVARGLTPGDAVAKVLHMREFMQKYQLPSDAEVKAAVQERNVSGEWRTKPPE
jgi:hypothetical protein